MHAEQLEAMSRADRAVALRRLRGGIFSYDKEIARGTSFQGYQLDELVVHLLVEEAARTCDQCNAGDCTHGSARTILEYMGLMACDDPRPRRRRRPRWRWVGPVLSFGAGSSLSWFVLGLIGYEPADPWFGGLLFAVLFAVLFVWDAVTLTRSEKGGRPTLP